MSRPGPGVPAAPAIGRVDRRGALLWGVLRAVPLVVVLGSVGLIAAHHLPRILAFWAAMLRFPFPMQGSESLIVWEAGRLARGESIYVANGPDRHGFVSGPYTPLYFAAVAATLKVSATVFTGGRLIALGCWLALVALAAAIVVAAVPRRAGGLGGLVAAVALATFTPGVIWAVRVKPTIPALALGAAGLLIVQRRWSSPGRASLWALVPLVAAYFTKQTTLAPAAAAALFLLVHAGWRAAARFVAVGLALGALPFGLLTLATGGEFFRHVVSDRRLAWQEQLLSNFGGLFLRNSWPLFAAAVLVALLLVRMRVAAIAPYYFVAAVAMVWTIGVEGADHDHLIELALATALAVGTGLAVAFDRRILLVPLAWPVAGLLLLQVATGWAPDRWYANELAAPDPAVRRQLELIVTNIRNTPGDVLSEEIGLIVLAGKPVPYDDPQAMAALARVGRWDQRQLLDDLNHRRFALVILPANPRDELWTPEVLAAIRANYDLKFRDVWFTYATKNGR